MLQRCFKEAVMIITLHTFLRSVPCNQLRDDSIQSVTQVRVCRSRWSPPATRRRSLPCFRAMRRISIRNRPSKMKASNGFWWRRLWRWAFLTVCDQAIGLRESPAQLEPIPYPSTPPAHLPAYYGSYHQLYRLDGRLVAMGVIDILPSCVSSVYFMWEKEYEKFSLGKVSRVTRKERHV